MTECSMYGCHKQAVTVLDIWVFCRKHAGEYKKKFADALKAQQAKGLNSK